MTPFVAASSAIAEPVKRHESSAGASAFRFPARTGVRWVGAQDEKLGSRGRGELDGTLDLLEAVADPSVPTRIFFSIGACRAGGYSPVHHKRRYG